jgi:UDP-N-acetylmuramate: L-alanyl-gamma-D-glutamyl-meso-diaminopimelate ligase
VADSIDELLVQIMQSVHAGDMIVCMSNGGFGGIHAKLLTALNAK